jgi:hypothetical protein
VLAYITWHRAAAGVDAVAYERALERFHRSLAHVPPSGFRGSSAFRVEEMPWRADAGEAETPGYEDWYLVDSWSALGVLEEAAVARGHASRHEAVAAMAAQATGAVYRLGEGHPRLADARVGVWVAAAQGHRAPTLADLLGDGMDREAAGLWRRCLGLGPAPEYCLLAPEVPAGVAPARLPPGWKSLVGERRAIWQA